MTIVDVKTRVVATCNGCPKSWDTVNAQGVGALHATHTGHQVVVEVTRVVTYGDGQPDPAQTSIEVGE